jgi:uncharacterized membrane protein
MKRDVHTKILFIISIIMLVMVFFIAKHYRDEVYDLKKRFRNLEILIEKHGRSDTTIQG